MKKYFKIDGSANNLGEMNHVSKESEQQNCSRDFGNAEGVKNIFNKNNSEKSMKRKNDEKILIEVEKISSEAEIFNYMVESLIKYIDYSPDERRGLAITPNVEDNIIYIQFGYYMNQDQIDYRFSLEFPEPLNKKGEDNYEITKPFGKLIEFEGQTYDLDSMFLPYMFQVITRLHLYTREDTPMREFWGKLNNPKIVFVFY